jgi:hypothetical protein
MKRLMTFIVIVFVIGLYATPVHANGIPELPHAFYGSVTINGAPAPAGTEVEARGPGVVTGIEGNPVVTTTTGIYGTSNPFVPRLVVQGDIEEGALITFYVDGVSTGQTASWHSGVTTELDLEVTISKTPSGDGAGAGGAPPPIISAILLCQGGVTKTTADICWKTDRRCDSQVEYWSNGHKLSVLDTEMINDHYVQLTGLTPATTYYFKIRSRDRLGNLVTSDEHTFATLGLPATFKFMNLSISPTEVNVGEKVTISVNVENYGDCEGVCKTDFRINGKVETTEQMNLKPGAGGEAKCVTTRNVAGIYAVDINGLTGSFTVIEKPVPALAVTPPPAPTPPAPLPPTPSVEPTNWTLISGIIAGIVILGLIIFFLVRRRAH